MTDVYLTVGLLDVLLERAGAAEPDQVSIGLAVTPAGEFDDLDLPPATPVFTTLYFPTAGRSIEAIFGSAIGTPAGQTPGLFVSHPDGALTLDRTDDLREVVFVAVPPWDRESVAAFERDGSRLELSLLDAAPPDVSRAEFQ